MGRWSMQLAKLWGVRAHLRRIRLSEGLQGWGILGRLPLIYKQSNLGAAFTPAEWAQPGLRKGSKDRCLN